MTGRRQSLLRRLAGIFLGGALALAGGCGVKTPPYPAREVLPAAPERISQRMTEDGHLVLSVQPPKKNMAGRPLKALGGFRVDMAAETLTPHYCQGCPRRFQEAGFVPAGLPPPGLDVPPGPFEYRRQLEQGKLYTFRVYSVSPRRQNHPEAVTETLVWSLLPPPAAQGFTGRLEDRAVRLDWQLPWFRDGQGNIRQFHEEAAPARLLAEVERRLGKGPWQALARPGKDEYFVTFTDYSLAYGDEPSYRVRWLLQMGGSRIPGPYSSEYTVKVIDFMPPVPPARLYAAASASGVRLNWDDSPDADLAGYRVYRRLEGQESFRLISGPGLVKENAFLDREASPEAPAYYQVTAVDNSPRANESAPSPPARVRAAPPLEPAPPRPAPPAIDEF